MQKIVKPQVKLTATARPPKASNRKPQVIAPYRVDLPRQDRQVAIPSDINGRSMIDGRL